MRAIHCSLGHRLALAGLLFAKSSGTMNAQQQRQSWQTAIKRFVFARTSLEAQLYPPLKRNVAFRIYEPRDFDTCIAIYRKNEAGRFPAGHGAKFVEYLKKDTKALIVAECDSRVVGYGGINPLAPNVATLCYGIVDPEFQGQRIGTALILLRIAQLSSDPVGAFVLIFAVDASMPIYGRFGFIEKTRWKAEDGKDHPVGLLNVPSVTLSRVKSALKRRGLSIQGNLALQPSGELSCEIQRDANGSYRLQLQPRAGGGRID
jgi:predicted N-acetyltransferase YhbS